MQDVLEPTVNRRQGSRWTLIAVSIILFSVAFQFVSLNEGQDWGGDFSLYLMHARNIAEGHPYADTGFVVNPLFLGHSPQAYPPLYPLLIAPLYKTAGLDYRAFKIYNLIFLGFGLWFLYLLAQRSGLTAKSAAALLLVVGVSPMLWSQRDAVLPDKACLMFSLCALWWHLRAESEKAGTWRAGVVTGILCGAAFACHNVGATLIPAICLAELWRHRITAYLGGMLSMFGVVLLAVHIVEHGGSDYIKMFHFSTVAAGYNVISYAHAIWSMFSGLHKSVQGVLTFVSVILSITGMWSTRRSPALAVTSEIVVCFGLLVVWSAASGGRYFLFIMPLFMLMTFCGGIAVSRQGRAVAYCVRAALILTLMSTACLFIKIPWHAIPEGISQPEFQALVQVVRQRVGRQDLVAFWNPRVLILYTRGRATTYSRDETAATNWRAFRNLGVRFIAVKMSRPDDFVLTEIAMQHAGVVRAIYENRDYALYEVGSSR